MALEHAKTMRFLFETGQVWGEMPVIEFELWGKNLRNKADTFFSCSKTQLIGGLQGIGWISSNMFKSVRSKKSVKKKNAKKGGLVIFPHFLDNCSGKNTGGDPAEG